jgi:hypothetical protein
MTLTATAARWRPTQVIALGYFDGPTEGVVKLSDGQIFRFSPLAEDVNREIRAFALATLSQQQFDDIVRLLSMPLGSPTWPIWVPLWRFANENLRISTEQGINAILAATEVVAVVVCSDDLQHCLGVRSITAQQLETVVSWFEFMNEQNASSN